MGRSFSKTLLIHASLVVPLLSGALGALHLGWLIWTPFINPGQDAIVISGGDIRSSVLFCSFALGTPGVVGMVTGLAINVSIRREGLWAWPVFLAAFVYLLGAFGPIFILPTAPYYLPVATRDHWACGDQHPDAPKAGHVSAR